MRIEITREMFDNMILLSDKGLSTVKIAELIGCSDSSVKNAVRAVNYAKAQNMDELRRLSITSKKLVDFACDMAGIKYEAPFKLEEKAEPKQDNTATAFATLVDAIKELTNAVNAIDKRLSAMQLTQQGFRGDMSEKIAKVIEAVHVEGDILTKEQTKMVELLGSIKSNTKR